MRRPAYHLEELQMRAGLTILSILLVFVSPNALIPQTLKLNDPDLELLCKRLQTDLDASLVGRKIAGGSAAVVLSDGRKCTAASGLTDFSGGRKITPDDRILAGSIGKTFVSALAMQLHEDGKLELDQKIVKWLDDRPWFDKLPKENDISAAEPKAKYTRETWSDVLKPMLSKPGAVKSRRLKSVVPTETGVVTVDFASSFERLPLGTEIVVLKREADANWRVSTYLIK
jgi:hypothetical protein